MNIALIAHDQMKNAIVGIAREFAAALRGHRLMATGTTGGRLRDEVGLDVECLLSGPLGGDLQTHEPASTLMISVNSSDASVMSTVRHASADGVTPTR